MIGMRPRGERRRGEVGEASCRPPPIPTPAGRSARGAASKLRTRRGSTPAVFAGVRIRATLERVLSATNGTGT